MATAAAEVAAVAPPVDGAPPTLAAAEPGAPASFTEDQTAFGPLTPARVQAGASGPDTRWVVVPALVVLVAVAWAYRRGRRRRPAPVG
jgi:hypothetical protein